MLSSPHTLMAAHDEFIYHLNDQLEQLYDDLARAKDALEYERQLLIKAQADLEALVKHKDKAREEWLEEQKKMEMKMLDEIAGQRYFRAKLQEELDNAEYEMQQQNGDDIPY
jgi:flagellar export protein FliJ